MAQAATPFTTTAKVAKAVIDWCSGFDEVTSTLNDGRGDHQDNTTNVAIRASVINTYGEIENWDFSQMTSFPALGLFYIGDKLSTTDCTFNASKWDVSKFTTLENAFMRMPKFNSDLSTWSVDNVTNLASAFNGASAFNSDLSEWRVDKVTNLEFAFLGASVFNSDISKWRVDKVTNLEFAFSVVRSGDGFSPSVFNSDLSKWRIEKVTNLEFAFFGASVFNSDLSEWTINSELPSLQSVFSGASAFNNDLSKWNTKNVISFFQMFNGATSFNGDLSKWSILTRDVPIVNMGLMFKGAIAFNGDLSKWEMSSVVNVNTMFQDAISFNGDVSKWDVSGVSSQYAMFKNAASFNQTFCSAIWEKSIITKEVFEGTQGMSFCCSPGSFYDTSATLPPFTCSGCSSGKMSAKRSTNTECVTCKPGKFSPLTGAMACSKCKDGQFSLSGADQCTLCPAGKRKRKEDEDEDEDDSTCVECAVHTFQQRSGREICLSCPAGYEQLLQGSAFCLPCESGKYGPAKGAACKTCQNGQYRAPGQNLTDCVFCSSVSGLVPNNQLTSCEKPLWKIKSDCDSSHYLNDTESNQMNWRCNVCPDGSSCEGDINASGVRALFGYSRCPNLDLTFERCVFGPVSKKHWS